MAESSRPPTHLSENETITNFANWQSNIMYHILRNHVFESFLQRREVRSQSPTEAYLQLAVKLLFRVILSWSECFDL